MNLQAMHDLTKARMQSGEAIARDVRPRAPESTAFEDLKLQPSGVCTLSNFARTDSWMSILINIESAASMGFSDLDGFLLFPPGDSNTIQRPGN
jgi:hypothetical protein